MLPASGKRAKDSGCSVLQPGCQIRTAPYNRETEATTATAAAAASAIAAAAAAASVAVLAATATANPGTSVHPRHALHKTSKHTQPGYQRRPRKTRVNKSHQPARHARNAHATDDIRQPHKCEHSPNQLNNKPTNQPTPTKEQPDFNQRCKLQTNHKQQATTHTQPPRNQTRVPA